MKKKIVKIFLIIIAVIVYFNIGYLVAYSINSETPKTTTTQIVYRILNFYDVMNQAEMEVASSAFVFSVIFWPFLAIMCLVINLAFMFLDFIWGIIMWIFTGGIWKSIGLIK